MDYRFYEELIEKTSYGESEKSLYKTRVNFDVKKLKSIIKKNNISMSKWATAAGYKECTLYNYASSGYVSLNTAINMFRHLCEDWELLLSSIELSKYERWYNPDRPEDSEKYSKDKPFTRLYLNKIKKENEQKKELSKKF